MVGGQPAVAGCCRPRPKAPGVVETGSRTMTSTSPLQFNCASKVFLHPLRTRASSLCDGWRVSARHVDGRRPQTRRAAPPPPAPRSRAAALFHRGRLACGRRGAAAGTNRGQEPAAVRRRPGRRRGAPPATKAAMAVGESAVRRQGQPAPWWLQEQEGPAAVAGVGRRGYRRVSCGLGGGAGPQQGRRKRCSTELRGNRAVTSERLVLHLGV